MGTIVESTKSQCIPRTFGLPGKKDRIESRDISSAYLVERGWHASCKARVQKPTCRERKNEMHDSMRGYGARSERTGFERVSERAMAYLRSRTADHWLMFAAGLVVGMIVG
jgi:hypothetical protein